MKKIFSLACYSVCSLSMALSPMSALAEFQPESIGGVVTLPEKYPDHWVMIHDVSFFHMFEGEVLVVDPLAEDLGAQYKGMMTASFIASYLRAPGRNEHYVVETFYSRGTRGGDRTDVLTIYDPATLKVTDEVVIPAKRITGMPKTMMAGLIGGEQFLGVYNFTPGQSVSIVDLDKREFVTEISTAGCGFLFANGRRSFTSICSNGSMLTSHLDDTGQLANSTKTDVLFDPDEDPVFEGAAVVDGVAYFPTFKGNVLPIDVSAETISAQAVWSLTSDSEKNWRPGGMRPVIADSEGVGYFLMHPEGAEGTHKDGGSEIWIYDLQDQSRTSRIKLTNWGISLGASGRGDNRLLLVTNSDMGVDVYRAPGGEFIKTLNVGAVTPFMVHGAE
jgi:methylamine dehydrogenase heavy chain